MGAFFSFFLILLLVFWLVSKIVKLLLSRWIKNKTQGRDYETQEQHNRADGEVFVSKDQTDKSEKVVEKEMGEYVDFETIKEDK